MTLPGPAPRDPIPALRDLLGERLLTSEAVRAQHAENEAWYPAALPDAVARPASTEEVSRLLALCHAAGMPVVAQGARSSLEGHHLAIRGGIALDLTGMDRVLAVHAEDLDAVVQPGVTRETLNAHLRDTGLFFPIDPAPMPRWAAWPRPAPRARPPCATARCARRCWRSRWCRPTAP